MSRVNLHVNIFFGPPTYLFKDGRPPDLRTSSSVARGRPSFLHTLRPVWFMVFTWVYEVGSIHANKGPPADVRESTNMWDLAISRPSPWTISPSPFCITAVATLLFWLQMNRSYHTWNAEEWPVNHLGAPPLKHPLPQEFGWWDGRWRAADGDLWTWSSANREQRFHIPHAVPPMGGTQTELITFDAQKHVK